MDTHIQIIEKSPGLDSTIFADRWRSEIAPWVTDLDGVATYVQNRVRERVDPELGRGVNMRPDAVSTIRFTDSDAMQRALASPGYGKYRDALAAIAERSVAFGVEHHVLTDPPPLAVGASERIGRNGSPLKKRITILRKALNLTTEQYRREWWDVHAAMVRALPEVEGYFGNHVERDAVEFGDSGGADQPVIDNLVELWFADAAAMRRALPPQGHVQQHAKAIHSNLTIVMADELRIA